MFLLKVSVIAISEFLMKLDGLNIDRTNQFDNDLLDSGVGAKVMTFS